MFKKFLWLEWKAFWRSSGLTSNLVIKIFMILGAVYFSVVFIFAGIGAYYLISEEMNQDPLVVISNYLIYYMMGDMIFRMLMQKIPVINTRPLLTLPVKRTTVVSFAFGKTLASFFNIIHAFFFVTFSILLLVNGYDPVGVLLWWLGTWLLIYSNNMLNLLVSGKDFLFLVVLVPLAGLVAAQYYGYFDVTPYAGTFYFSLFSTYYMILVPVVLFTVLWIASHRYYLKQLYLDTGLKGKIEIADTREYAFLNRFGLMGTFLKNDLKLILRNKRSKTTVLTSLMFVFYGLLFYTGGIEMYDNSGMKMFASIFVTGGFLLTFGQFVPSWDSSYYPLMMSQNIKYSEYIASKWWLMVVGTVVGSIFCTFYLYFGIDIYLMIIAGAVFNIGVNSLLVLLAGAFVKTPIDLASAKQAFGDKKAFNMKTFLLSLPKMLLPMGLYILGSELISPMAGCAFVAGAGLLGLAFRNAAFRRIEKIYRSEKYSTLDAYKQKN